MDDLQTPPTEIEVAEVISVLAVAPGCAGKVVRRMALHRDMLQAEIKRLRAEAQQLGESHGRLREENLRFRQELSALQTTIAKLPKCRRLDEHGNLVQDVPVVPGMEVWLTGGGEYPGEVECVGEGDAVIVNDSIHWMASPLGEISDGSVRDASTLFITREAADAAEGGE